MPLWQASRIDAYLNSEWQELLKGVDFLSFNLHVVSDSWCNIVAYEKEQQTLKVLLKDCEWKIQHILNHWLFFKYLDVSETIAKADTVKERSLILLYMENFLHFKNPVW